MIPTAWTHPRREEKKLMTACDRSGCKDPATTKEIVTLAHTEKGTTQASGSVCGKHGTTMGDWEVEGWRVRSFRQVSL